MHFKTCRLVHLVLMPGAEQQSCYSDKLWQQITRQQSAQSIQSISGDAERSPP